MASNFTQFKQKALSKPAVRQAYDDLGPEYGYLEEVLRARKRSGLSQAELAARIGTTQSAIARMESASGGHSPSIHTLQRYAKALGCRLQIRLVKDRTL